MKRIILLGLFAIVGLALSIQIAFAQANSSSQGDSSVKATLDKLGYKYEVTSDGNYRLNMQLPNGRIQIGYIYSQTENDGKLNIRKVVSPGYKSNAPLSASVANQLLENSGSTIIGAWQTVKGANETYLTQYAAKLPANSDAQMLGDTLSVVLKNADQMEKVLTGKDNY